MRSEVVIMRKALFSLILMFIAASVMAGDLAVFENLGFSPDGRYFMFGQHVLVSDAGQAYAETAIVDISRNDFVPGGWKKGGWNVPMLPNQESRGALFELLRDSREVIGRYKISHLEQGRLLYIRRNGDKTAAEDSEMNGMMPSLTFRDFEYAKEYSLNLHQETKANDAAVSSAFHIEMTVMSTDGRETSYTVGRMGYFRRGVSSYEIIRVLIGPNGKSLVVIVAKTDIENSVRYMVETLVLK